MDIALHVPELVHSHELRSHISRVSKDNKLTRTVDPTVKVSCCCFCPDATAEHSLSADSQGVTAGPPGPRCNVHGLRLAGRRKACGQSI